MEREVIYKVKGAQAIDGAGVHLVRVLGPGTVKEFDPILMLDSFDSKDPDDYTKGFPMHPHRGIETISYISDGQMMHKDSMGYEDTISSGEVQWMTAGAGIMHEEMIPESERLLGVQLWLNMPAKDKMEKADYHSIRNSRIKEIPFAGGKLRLLAGNYGAYSGFLSSYLPFDYYDIHLNAGSKIEIPTNNDGSVMLFTLSGNAEIGGMFVEEKTAVKMSEGTLVKIKVFDEPAQVLFMSSKALNEPVAWGGPVVMNTNEELEQAWTDLENNTFVRHK